MSKEDAVLEAFKALGVDATPAAVKAWVKEKHAVEVGVELVTRTRQEVRARVAAETAASPPPEPRPTLNVAVVTEALEVARRLVHLCGDKESTKRLIDAA